MAQTDLGKWMITNGGEYDPSVTYEQLTMVKYGNSTYITLKTVTGVTPDNDKINYQLMAQGFDATALSAVTAQDSQGLLGDKGSEVSAQSLIDALADKVMNTVIAKLGTGNLPTGMNDVISGLATLNSNIECNNVTVQSAPGTIVDKEITFKTPFDTVPKVIVSIESDTANSNYGKITAFINNRSKTGFVIRLANASENNLTPALTWLAIAK